MRSQMAPRGPWMGCSRQGGTLVCGTQKGEVVFTVRQSLSAVYESLTELQFPLWERSKATDTPGSPHSDLKYDSLWFLDAYSETSLCKRHANFTQAASTANVSCPGTLGSYPWASTRLCCKRRLSFCFPAAQT